MERLTKETIRVLSVLMVVGVGLILASTAYAASVYAQANSTSSTDATNMTSTGAHESAIGAAGNITIVLVTMEVNEGKKQEALNSLIPLGELARKRQGNIDYDIYSSTENPNELVLVQLWSSKEAFDRHYNSPEASQLREMLIPLTVKPAQIKTYAEVGKIQ